MDALQIEIVRFLAAKAAQAGIQHNIARSEYLALGPRFRGHERRRSLPLQIRNRRNFVRIRQTGTEQMAALIIPLL